MGPAFSHRRKAPRQLPALSRAPFPTEHSFTRTSPTAVSPGNKILPLW